MIRHLCAGTSYSSGGVQGGMRRGRKAQCPVCFRIRMRVQPPRPPWPHRDHDAKPGDQRPPR